MPAIVTCKDKCCEQQWNVGSDDFVVPAAIAIVVGLFNFSLIGAVLLAFYYIPSDSPSSCNNFTYSPLLYAPLFGLAMVEVCFMLNEGLILIVSARGPIFKQTKSFMFRQKFIPHLIYLRIFLAVMELFAVIASLVGVFHPLAISAAEDCSLLKPRLKFARAVVILQVISFALFLVKVCIYTDPLGCATPGLMERLNFMDDADARGSLVLMPSDQSIEDSQRLSLNRNISVDATSAAKEINVWRRQTKILDMSSHDINRVTKVHNDSVNMKKYERKLRAIFCCLGVRGQRSRGVALEDVARGLYTMFSEMDIVLSDVIAGFSLLSQSQSKKKREGEIALTKKFRMVTFKMMSRPQRMGLDPGTLREDQHFDFTEVQNQLLFEDLVHYMSYAMGVYGWPLHIFDNLGCGICQLCTVTCCRFRCLHRRVRKKDFNKDNCCMCGVGALRLQTGIKEDDILYVNFQNKIYLAPFIVCLDHKMKSVVICVRGTLSLKDTLTDMSFSPIHKKVEGIKETYVHGGMYRAAVCIINTLNKHKVLKKAFETHKNYQLVVTGHSLGAGVASILSLLLKQKMKYSDQMMRCYAFSPPGALFSFPLAEYSKNFITSVVVGNDIVPRITLRALLHLKFSVKHLLSHSEKPKYQILCRSRTCATLCKCFDKSKEAVKQTRDKSSLYSVSTSQQNSSARSNKVGSRRGKEVVINIDEDSKDPISNGDSVPVGNGTEDLSGQLQDDDAEYTQARSSVSTTVPLRKWVSNDSSRSGGSFSLDRDNSIEWMVFDEGSTTASIRHKVFERSISIQPSSLPTPTVHQKLSRFASGQRPVLRRQSSIAFTLASEIKKAVSLDLSDGVLPEGLIQGTTDDPLTESQQIPRTTRVTQMRVKADSSDEVSTESFTSETRCRKNSDPTPGGVIDNTVPMLLEHCRADESKAFMPFFPPGRMLHLQVKKSDRCCGIDELSVKEVNRENMCVILIDNGIVDDHLPNHVLSALKDCQARFMTNEHTHNREAIQESRNKTANLIHKIRSLSSEDSVCKVEGFKFMGASPMQEPAGGSSLGGRAARLSQLRKQASVEMDGSNLYPPVSSQYATGLTRISECADEDATSAQIDDADMTSSNQVLVHADINESAFLDEVDADNTTQDLQAHAQMINSPGGTASSQSETAFAHSPSHDDSVTVNAGPDLPSSASRSEMKLFLGVSDSGSTDNLSGNRLLARRNISNENLKLTMPANAETVTSL